jgi:hypothetical protein
LALEPSGPHQIGPVLVGERLAVAGHGQAGNRLVGSEEPGSG